MSQKDVLFVSEEEEKEIVSQIMPNEEIITNYVKEIENWLEKQPHLPKNEEITWLRTLLIFSKFNVEKAKKKLEMLYTSRTLLPIFFEGRDPSSPFIQKIMKAVMLCPLPKLNDDLCRVHVFRFLSEPEEFDNDAYSKYLFMTVDIRCGFAKEFCVGDHFILDYETAKTGHILKTNPAMLKKGLEVLRNSYVERIKGFHLINFPSFANTFVSVASSMLTEKLKNRIYIHNDYESLKKIISPRILPLEYGGEEKSLAELNNNWNKYLESAKDWYKIQETRKSDESLRPNWSPLDPDLYGVEGSFRKLNVD